MSSIDLVDQVRRRLAVSPGPVADAVRVHSGIADNAALANLERQVTAELVGVGPLEVLLATPGVTDVLVNGADEVWVDQPGGLVRTGIRFPDDDAVRRLGQRLASAAGRRLDDASPYVDAALSDGTRLHVIIPPLVTRPTLSLRVLSRRPFALEDLADSGMFDRSAADLLRAVVAARLAFLVCGGTGTGKTTLLGALLAHCRPDERLIIVEDTPEVCCDHPHVVRLMCRSANIEGAGAVGPRELIAQALRMRPDRLVVGEFRGPEFADLVAALNTGHEGGAATMHANSAFDLPARFAALGGMAGLDGSSLRAQVTSAFDVVLALTRGPDRRRRLEGIYLLRDQAQALTIEPAWSSGRAGSAAAALVQLLTTAGVAAPAALQ